MLFYSTRHQSPPADLRTAVMQSLPADNGLYMPEELGQLPPHFFEEIESMSFVEQAVAVAQCLLQDSISASAVATLVERAITFPAPLVKLDEQFACLELFHGPSLAFKDFGARFMAQLMSYFVQQSERKLYILVATSGDTGGAVAQGFLGAEGIEVIILYPSGKVSGLQEKQLTTLGQNVTALEVNGTFDDCQRLVKSAFLDAEINQRLQLSSANSINIARLIPQAFYYVNAFAQAKQYGKKLVFAVPSGNFGNLTAGLLAKRIGLPVHHFVAANNANNVFTQYYLTDIFAPRPSVSTLSNAMDVGNPSNFQRIEDLYQNDVAQLRTEVTAYDFDDAETKAAMQEVYERYNYVVCPHTAVAYAGAKRYLEEQKRDDLLAIFLSTAHPAKFLDIVENTLNIQLPLPESLANLQTKEKKAISIGTDYGDLRAFLQKLN